MDAIIGTGNISKRRYGIVAERDVFVTMSDGVNINVDVFRPDADGKFPALLSMSPYSKEVQSDRMWPGSSSAIHVRGVINTLVEAGNTDFFVRRGYVHIIGSVRGTGKSGGAFQFMGANEIRDIYEIVEWAAAQPWCDGNVGMLGISYFAWNQQPAAALQPPHLKAICPLFAPTDIYRDMWCHGGNPLFSLSLGFGLGEITHFMWISPISGALLLAGGAIIGYSIFKASYYFALQVLT
jgi:putative CocE/NonD family hydrolase